MLRDRRTCSAVAAHILVCVHIERVTRPLPLDPEVTDAKARPRKPSGIDSATADQLLTRWSEPHRHHHTVEHLRGVLGALDRLADEGEKFDREATDLAAWFHDAIYDVAAADSEQRSADLAAQTLNESTTRDEVVRLVLLTADHKVAPSDANGAALSDADLAILGAPADEYDRYARNVREEFRAVPDEWFRPGRAAVLGALLGDGDLFHTRAGRRLWQNQALSNLRREIARLS